MPEGGGAATCRRLLRRGTRWQCCRQKRNSRRKCDDQRSTRACHRRWTHDPPISTLSERRHRDVRGLGSGADALAPEDYTRRTSRGIGRRIPYCGWTCGLAQTFPGALPAPPLPAVGLGLGHTWCFARSSALDHRIRSPGRIAPPHFRHVVAKLAVRWKTATSDPQIPARGLGLQVPDLPLKSIVPHLRPKRSGTTTRTRSTRPGSSEAWCSRRDRRGRGPRARGRSNRPCPPGRIGASLAGSSRPRARDRGP